MGEVDAIAALGGGNARLSPVLVPEKAIGVNVLAVCYVFIHSLHDILCQVLTVRIS